MDTMIIMGEITCRLNADAIKPTILYCSEPDAYRFQEWSLGYGWATAFFTLLLALFALLAWLNSQKTLRKMEDQISANRDLMIESRQRELLEDYCTALIEMADNLLKEGVDFHEMSLRTTTAWTRWSMALFANSKEFRALTAKWNENITLEAYQIRELMDQPTSVHLPWRKHRLSGITADYIGALQSWQVDPAQRDKTEANFASPSVVLFHG